MCEYSYHSNLLKPIFCSTVYVFSGALSDLFYYQTEHWSHWIGIIKTSLPLNTADNKGFPRLTIKGKSKKSSRSKMAKT